MVSSGVGPGDSGSMHGYPSEGPTTNDITNPKKYKVPYPQKNSSLKTQTSQNKSIEMQLFPDKRDFTKAERHSSEQPHPASNFDNISPTKTSLEDDAQRAQGPAGQAPGGGHLPTRAASSDVGHKLSIQVRQRGLSGRKPKE